MNQKLESKLYQKLEVSYNLLPSNQLVHLFTYDSPTIKAKEVIRKILKGRDIVPL